MSCRIEEQGTWGREDFIRFIKEQAVLRQYTGQQVKRIAYAFFDAMQYLILHGYHIDLRPLGFLVVEPIRRESVMLYFDGAPERVACQGFAVRFRSAVPAGGTVVSRDWLQEMRRMQPGFAQEIDFNDIEARLIFMEWVVFMKKALRQQCRIEIRGVGAFNIHQREVGTVYSRHAGDMVPCKSARHFKFKVARSLKDRLRALAS